MHKYFVYWDLIQHLPRKNTLQHFQREGRMGHLGHAYGRNWPNTLQDGICWW